MYSLYLDGMLLPVTPKKVEIFTGGRSRLVTLINDGQASMPQGPELSQISFTALLPQVEYPFARYENGFTGAEFYLERLKALKEAKLPFRFVLSRWTPGGKRLFDTNLRVTLEEYSVEEDAGQGFDLEVKILLRQHREMALKMLEIDGSMPDAPVILEENRAVDSEEGKSSGKKSGASSGSASRKGQGILAPSTGTKEAATVAGKAAQAAAKTTAVTAVIPGLSTLLGITAAGGTAAGKTKVTSRR